MTLISAPKGYVTFRTTHWDELLPVTGYTLRTDATIAIQLDHENAKQLIVEQPRLVKKKTTYEEVKVTFAPIRNKWIGGTFSLTDSDEPIAMVDFNIPRATSERYFNKNSEGIRDDLTKRLELNRVETNEVQTRIRELGNTMLHSLVNSLRSRIINGNAAWGLEHNVAYIPINFASQTRLSYKKIRIP